MNSDICRISPLTTKAPAQAILLSKSLMKQWGCLSGQSIKIKVGNKTCIARVAGLKRSHAQIYLPRSVYTHLSLPYFGSIRATYIQKELRIGPVIAILTTGFTGSPTAPFGLRSALFRNFLTAAQEDKPIFYVFTPEMVDWNNQVTSGWFYQPNANGSYQWIRRTVPLPDVVYERIPNRKSESLPRVLECRERLRSHIRCQIFNQGFFNKWTVHEKLHNHELAAEHIPETYHSPSVSVIREMLERHQMVYLKPNGGSLGLGIFRITRHPNKGYFCRFREGDNNILRRFFSLEALLRHAFGPQLNRLPRYLVQQGIRLVKYNGRSVDFRVHMHKDKQGKWQVVGMGAKVAGLGSVTTHGRTGGSLLTAEELLSDSFPGKEKGMMEHIQNVSIQIARALEGEVNGHLGELGLDIGVDRYRKVWLFEVNSKPGRSIFLHPSLRSAGRQSARYITEYSMKLAQFV
ncbi:YheC/YheD family protein [Desmospora activa]|uniref:YheC/D-like protein n=1 Tax=Desmospora activa DSM 45169 TaxID=1121389 RepID=A0A2T4Z825_9BACL|nr:YheC/YheD family protein [Desmospora activa]PTM58051.1 YheC/D-like protein [Desmospora activa DSM 45169]